MDGHKDPLTDDAIAREIESALTVEPSPHFVAKVRERVAREPLGAPGAAWWTLGLGGAAVVAVALALFVFMTGKPPATHAPEPRRFEAASTPGRDVSSAPSVPTEAAIVPERIVSRPPRRSGPVARPTDARIEAAGAAAAEVKLPEVVIPENEKRGFELLVTELRDSKHATAVAEATRGLITPGPPWLEIAPVIIDPLRDVATAEGEGQ